MSSPRTRLARLRQRLDAVRPESMPDAVIAVRALHNFIHGVRALERGDVAEVQRLAAASARLSLPAHRARFWRDVDCLRQAAETHRRLREDT